MVVRIDSDYELQNYFEEYGRDYYSLDGYDYILNYFDDDTELDVIEIACSFTEYGEGASLSFKDFFSDYKTEYDDISGECDTEEMYDDEIIDLMIDSINEYAYAVQLDNGNVMIIE